MRVLINLSFLSLRIERCFCLLTSYYLCIVKSFRNPLFLFSATGEVIDDTSINCKLPVCCYVFLALWHFDKHPCWKLKVCPLSPQERKILWVCDEQDGPRIEAQSKTEWETEPASLTHSQSLFSKATQIESCVVKSVFRGVEVEMVLMCHSKYNGKVKRVYYIL